MFTLSGRREMPCHELGLSLWVGHRGRLESGLPCAPRKVLGPFWALVSLSILLSITGHVVVGVGVARSAATTWVP